VSGRPRLRGGQRRGIAAFVVDGVIRDLAETRERGFPVFARGVIPIPGAKDALGVLDGPVRCGGVDVAPGDAVIAEVLRKKGFA
jgi:4-hydroxy-4-methyl-2-oxoglutarate aldolase